MNDATTTDPVQANRAALAAMSRGDYAQAVTLFSAAIAADPAASPLHRNLASAYRAMADDAGELAALDAALALDQTDFAALLRKAQLLERTGDPAKALVSWSGVLTMAAALDNVPPELRRELDAGQRYLTKFQEQLSTVVNGALGADIDVLPATAARRARAFVDIATGRRRAFTNQCAGIYYPFLPADEFFDDHHFPWFADLAAATPAIRAELETLLADGDAALRPYVRMDKGTPDSKWSALDHSLDWGACFLWEYGEPNAPVIERCPATAAAMRALPAAVIPSRAPNVFFSLLKPHTHIPAHTGVSNTRAIIHLPLIVPANCRFRVGNETREWTEGRAFAFDDTIEHEAWNDSDSLRAVLIFDVWNPHLTPEECDVIARYYAAADAAGLQP